MKKVDFLRIRRQASRLFLALLALGAYFSFDKLLSVEKRLQGGFIAFIRDRGWGPHPATPVLVFSLSPEGDRDGPEYPRQKLAHIVKEFDEAGVRSLALDVVLSADTSRDSELASSLRNFAVHAKSRGGMGLLLACDVERDASTGATFPQPLAEPFLEFPVAPAVWERDDDGMIRRLEPKMDFGIDGVSHFCARMAGGTGTFSPGQQVLVDYRMRAEEVMQVSPITRKKFTAFEKKRLANSWVVLAATDRRLADRHDLPIAVGGEEADLPGVYALAYGYQTLKTGARLQSLEGSWVWVWVSLLAGVGMALPFLRHKRSKDKAVAGGLPPTQVATDREFASTKYFLIAVLSIYALVTLVFMCIGIEISLAGGALILLTGFEVGQVVHAISSTPDF